MTSITDKLLETQKKAISLRPKVGGFPIFAEVLRQAGIKMNRWFLPSCQSIYIMEEGSVLQQGNPIVTGTHEIPKFNKDNLILALRTDQAGDSTFPEFLVSVWKAGVISYDADFNGRKVIYYGVNGEKYLEEYQAVEIDHS